MKSKLDHFALYTHDVEEMVGFFTRYFHAEPQARYRNNSTGFSSCFLTFEGGGRLEVMNRPEVADAPSVEFPVGYAHLAIGVGSRKQVDLLTQQMVADGYRLYSPPRVTGDGYYESCVRGPEQILVEITE